MNVDIVMSRELDASYLAGRNESAAIVEGGDLQTGAVQRHWVEPRRDILGEGETPSDLHIITRGLACRYQIMRDGSRRIIGFLFPGDACDADLFILPESDHGVRTLIRTEVASISRQTILRLMSGNPEVARIFWSSTVQEGAMLRHWLVKMGQQKAYGRAAHLLFELFLRYEIAGNTSANSFVLPLTQDELADTLGMTPVHVNRILQRLRQEGLIALQGRRLTIVDRVGLERVADFDPRYRQSLERTPLGALLGLRLR
jgi:CRP-like cAMP-binding protein